MKTTIAILLIFCASFASAQFTRQTPPGTGISAATAGGLIRDSIIADNAVEAARVTEIFVFGFGSGAATDTAACTATAYYGGFFNATDTLQITHFNGVLGHGIGADTITFQISWDDSANGASSPTTLWTTPIALNSTTRGIAATVMQNAKIPPGVWIWGTTPTVVAGRKPVWLLATMSGKRIKP